MPVLQSLQGRKRQSEITCAIGMCGPSGAVVKRRGDEANRSTRGDAVPYPRRSSTAVRISVGVTTAWSALILLIALIIVPKGSASTVRHIVVHLLDDIGYADLGFAGAEFPTPRMDELVKEGVKLRNHYSQPLCSPTRSLPTQPQSLLQLRLTCTPT